MQIRVRTLMVVVALLALGFASSDPVTALLLIFSCPLWIVRFVRMRGARAGGTGADDPSASRRRPPAF